MMSNLITLLFVVVFIYIVIRRATQLGRDPKKAANRQNSAAAKQQRPRGYTNYKPHKDITSVTRDMGDKKNSVLRDDTNNDWLAKQLAEEHRAFKATSEMFDLKIEHASHCDAKLLEQFHKRNCTAEGVDLANGSTIRRMPH